MAASLPPASPPALALGAPRGAPGDLRPQNASPSLAGSWKELFGGGRSVTPHLPCVGLCPPLVTGSRKDRAERAALKTTAPAQAQAGVAIRLGWAQSAKARQAERHDLSMVKTKTKLS